MLKEKIIFEDKLPVNIYLSNIEEYPIHFHDDFEILYVVEGSVELKNGYYTYILKKDDVFILNEREIHGIYATEESNIVLTLQISSDFVQRYCGDVRNHFFVTDMKDTYDESLDNLRKLLIRIMMEKIRKNRGYAQRISEYTNEFVLCLINDFQFFSLEEGKFVNEIKNKSNKVLAERMKRITDLMYENYSRKLTLQEIAEHEHLSVYYLSHVIKESVGLSFQDFLNFIRVEESEKLLLGTDKKIGTIAEECGFSAIRYYIKYFEKWFGCHPAEYRKRYANKVQSRETAAKYYLYNSESTLNILKKYLSGFYGQYEKDNFAKIRMIEIDCGEHRKYLKIKKTEELECGFEMIQRYSSDVAEICKDLKLKRIAIAYEPDEIDLSGIEHVSSTGIKVVLRIKYKGETFEKIEEIIKRIRKRVSDPEAVSIEIIFDEEIYYNDFKFEIKKTERSCGCKIKTVLLENAETDKGCSNFSFDSILMLPYIIKKASEFEGKADSGINTIFDNAGKPLFIEGGKGIITSSLIKKPSYYAYKMLSELTGEIIGKGDGYIASRSGDNFRILLYSEGENIDSLVENPAPADEIAEIIKTFQKDTEFIVKIRGLSGEYKIKRYKLSKENCLLSMHARNGFYDVISKEEEMLYKWGTCPNVAFNEARAAETLDIHSYLSEFSAELIIIDKK